MNIRVLALAALSLTAAGVIATQPADARSRQRAPAACDDRPAPFTWSGLVWNGKPQPNGCAPAVIEGGDYIGQDPDPNIRLQLRRDPTNNGYTYSGGAGR